MNSSFKNIDKNQSLLFFSGGSALNETASILSQHVFTTHIITTFDSGGSTAALRKSLHIPAVGDLRSRMLAMADRFCPIVASLCRILDYRFPTYLSQRELESKLYVFKTAKHPLFLNLGRKSQETKDLIVNSLKRFISIAPADFSYSGASFGNIILASEYFACGKNMLEAVCKLARILKINGRVLPVSEECAHLAVKLENGEVLLGQHKFTGKWGSSISAPIKDLWLSPSPMLNAKGGSYSPDKIEVSAGACVLDAISTADCICYSMGSFFSSVLSNLLVSDIASAIAKNNKAKVFIPNPGADPELLGFTLKEQVEFLLSFMKKGQPDKKEQDFISHILVDKEKGAYQGGVPDAYLASKNIKVINTRLVKADEDENLIEIDGDLLARLLLEENFN